MQERGSDTRDGRAGDVDADVIVWLRSDSFGTVMKRNLQVRSSPDSVVPSVL